MLQRWRTGMGLVNVKVPSRGILGKGLGLSEPQLPELTVASLGLSLVYRYIRTYVHKCPRPTPAL